MPRVTGRRTAPTARAVGLIASSVICGVLGIAAAWAPLIGVAAAGLVLVVLGALFVLGGTSVTPQAPSVLRVERFAAGVVTVRLVGPGLRHRSALRLRSGDELVCVTPDAGGATVTMPVSTRSRGVQILGPWTLERIDPFGLWVRTVASVDQVEALVIPRITVLSPGAAPAFVAERGQPTAGNSTVATLREYVVGDELRQIHWRSSARTGTLMVRQYVDVTRPTLVVLVDLDPSHYRDGGDVDDAVDLAASIAVSISGIPVEVHTSTGVQVSLSNGRGPMLDVLARAPAGPGAHRPRAGTVVLVDANALGRRS